MLGFDEASAPFRGSRITEVQASVGKACCSPLLDEVERGRTTVILRHGMPVARVVPDTEARNGRGRRWRTWLGSAKKSVSATLR